MSGIKKKTFLKVAVLAMSLTLSTTACNFGESSSSLSSEISSVSSLVSSESSKETSVTSSSNLSSSSEQKSSSSSSSKPSSSSSSVAPTVTGITLNTNNVKKAYFYGEALDLTGLVVTASMSNGSNKVLAAGEYTTDPADKSALNQVGQVKVTVSYQSFKQEFNVEVSKKLEGITIDTANVKKAYKYGETLDLTGLVVTANYNNNTTQVVDNYTTNPAKGSALTTLGQVTVTVTYEGFNQEFKIEVSKALEGITLNTNNVKKYYHYGQELDLTGLVVTANYNNNTSEEVSDYTTDPAKGAKLTSNTGKQDITVSYNSFSEKYSVDVDAGSALNFNFDNFKSEYIVGEKLDLTGLVGYLEFKDNNDEQVEFTTYPADGAVLNQVGTATIEAYANNLAGKQLHAVFYVEVKPFAETGTHLTLDLSAEPTFVENVATVQALGTKNSDYSVPFKLTKVSTAADSMTIVNNAKLRVMQGDTIENTEALGGVTAITVTGGNGNFRLFAGYTQDNMYEFLEAESNQGDRIFENIPHMNYFKLVGKYDSHPADISAIEFDYTRNENHELVYGQAKAISEYTVNQGEFVKSNKTLTVTANTVVVNDTEYTFAGVEYQGALLYVNAQGNGVLVKFVSDYVIIVTDCADKYSSITGEYSKVIPATKIKMFVDGEEREANDEDSREEMEVNEVFDFSATCDAVPAETVSIELVDESNADGDEYVGTYSARDTISVSDIYYTIGDFELKVDPIVVTKVNGQYKATYADEAYDAYPGNSGTYDATVKNNKISFGDENLTVSINLETKRIEFAYEEEENIYCFLTGEIAYDFETSNKPTATFEDGEITALNPGNFYMYCKTSNGVEAKYFFEVSSYIPAYIIQYTSAIELKKGETAQIDVEISENATDDTVLFESTNNSVATVDDSGFVTAVGVGECDINIISADDQVTVEITVVDSTPVVAKTFKYLFEDSNGDEHELVVKEEVEATLDDTYHFTYSDAESVYAYDEDDTVVFEIRVSGSQAYLDFVDPSMVLFGYDGPVYSYDIDYSTGEGEIMIDSFEEVVDENGNQGGQGGEQPVETVVTYTFSDQDGGDHIIVITEEKEALLDNEYHFTYSEGYYVYDEDDSCFFEIRKAGSVFLDYYDENMTIFGYNNFIVTMWSDSDSIELTIVK